MGEARYRAVAEELPDPLGVPSIKVFRQRLRDRAPLAGEMFGGSWSLSETPFSDLDHSLIGTA